MHLTSHLLIKISGCALCLGIRPGASISPVLSESAPQYDLLVRIIPESTLMEVSGTVMLPAARYRRDSLELSLSELMRDLRVDVISPAGSAGRTTATSRLRPNARKGWGTNTWTVRPSVPVPLGSVVTLQVHYRGGGVRTSEIFSINHESAFGAGIKTAWYPELEESSGPTLGELRGVRGTGIVRFNLPDGFTVYMPGRRSGPAGFQFDRPIFFSFVMARYLAVHRNATPPVSGYLLRSRPTIGTYLDGISQILEVLVKEFGPFPSAQFAVAEVPASQADSAGFEGASLEGLVLASSTYLDKPFNTAYFGHELSHQWWPNLVASKTSGGVRTMISEGLAQYGSLRAVEELDGQERASQYRRVGYPEFYGYSEIDYLRLAAAGHDGALSDPPADNTLQRELVLSKGMLVWDMLSRSIGREQFRAALHEITRTFAYRRIGWPEFLAIVQRHSDHDLSRFVADWFDRAGAPNYRLSWSQDHDGEIRGRIVQSPPYYAATLQVEARSDSGILGLRQVAIDSSRADFTWRLRVPARHLVLDARHLVLRWDANDRADAIGLAPFTRVSLLINQGRDQEAERSFAMFFQAPSGADSVGLRFMMHFAYAELLASHERYAESLREIRLALAERVRRPDALPLVFDQLAKIGYATGDAALTTSAADSALAADSLIGSRTGAGAEASRLSRALANSAAVK